MSRSAFVLASALVLGGLAGTARPFFLASGSGDLPSLSGTYSGKCSYKGYYLFETGYDEKGKCPLTLTVDQFGSDIKLVFTPECPADEKMGTFALTGMVGNGHFWASGVTYPNADSPEFVVFSGKAWKDDGKLHLKGKGVVVTEAGSECTEMTITAKRPL